MKKKTSGKDMCTQPPMDEKIHDYLADALSREESKAFEMHLFGCPSCRQRLQRLQHAFDIMRENKAFFEAKFAESSVLEGEEARQDQSTQPRRATQKKRWPLYSMAAGLALLVGLLSWLYFLSPRPTHYDLAMLGDETRIPVFKSNNGENGFARGLREMQTGQYLQAIHTIEAYIKTHPDHYQAHYYAGLAYLTAGEQSSWGRPHFSESNARQSLQYLQTALMLAGDNPYYQEDCLWLMGKAWLRLGNVENARAVWQEILILPPQATKKEKVKKALQAL